MSRAWLLILLLVGPRNFASSNRGNLHDNEDNYLPSLCTVGTERPSWAKIIDDAMWENWRRRRAPFGEQQISGCQPPYRGKLTPEQVIEQHRMFDAQDKQRKEFSDARALWAVTGPTKYHNEHFLYVGSHARRLEKYPQCMHLGLVHQLLNLECEINLALQLKRTLFPFPLVEDDRFTGCGTQFQRFSSIVSLAGLPVDEIRPWEKANETFLASMDPEHLKIAQKSNAAFIRMGRDLKERQSNFCVEYAWYVDLKPK